MSRVDAATATETDASVPSYSGWVLLTPEQRYIILLLLSQCRRSYNSTTYAPSATLVDVAVNRTLLVDPHSIPIFDAEIAHSPTLPQAQSHHHSMPSRRRPGPILSAAALPASRLPLGTPLLPTPTSHGSASTHSHSPPRSKPATTDSGSDKEDSASPPTDSHSKAPSIMAPNTTSENAPFRSIAETKLERQNRRIQEVDAAITNKLPSDKRAHQSRGKKNKWQPLDLSETTRSTTPSEGGVPVSEVRVNTFRAPSRGSSLSRPVSVMSHRTSETGPSDMDRQDSALTDHGFQVFQGRRHRKNLGNLHAYEDKPEERQTTVEGTTDAREVYNVFGNALPGPEVIGANEGSADGEVRFIQQPTGDILAYQWSSGRYLWENIGQFSGHRNRVEGQLAADRLKGETAYQSLQRTTLAYFRIIAKQREANVMGRPFGPKDIQAALPEPRSELSAAPTGLKPPTHESGVPEQPRVKPVTILSTLEAHSAIEAREHEPAATLQPSLLPHHVPTAPRADRYKFNSSYTQYEGRQDDPFYSVNPYQQIYGNYPSYPNPHYGQPTEQPRPMVANPATQQPQYHRPVFQFPQATGQSIQTTEITSPFLEVEDFAKQGVEQWQQQNRTNHPTATMQNRPQYRTTGTLISSNSSDATLHPTVTQVATEASRPKPVTPLENRSAIRDNLWKHAEAAKERSLSQGSILSRTVLYDPLQNQSPSINTETDSGPVKQDISPTLNKSSSRKILQLSQSNDVSSSRTWPVIPAPTPQLAKPTSPVGTVLQNLNDSSPDPYPTKQSYTYQAPVINTPQDSQGTPQTFRGPYFATEQGTPLAPADQKTYDELLNDWWTSGQKFARQEEFYRSILSSSARQPSPSAHSNLPAHLVPIGSRNKTNEPAYNTTTTRLLIPVLENLASYVQGPVEKRRDYFSQWVQPPDWCIDRREGGNNSFFDKDWGTPPARVGRDPRYNRSPSVDDRTPLRGRYPGNGGVSLSGSMGGSGYVDRRFGFGGGYYG